MKRDDEVSWGGLGRIEKSFLLLTIAWALLFFTGLAPKLLSLAGMAAILMGVIAIVKLGRMAMRNLIWRLRNRLIVAYLFIAVVPIVLILALMLVTSYALIGQMAVYLVNRELDNRMRTLLFPAETLTRAPARDPQTALTRALPMLRRGFPSFEMLATGEQTFRYPPDSNLSSPPEPWKNASGLITRKDGDTNHLYAWAHSEQGGNEVTILAPITSELLATLVPGIGDVTFPGYTQRPSKSNVPPAMNGLDIPVSFLYPVFVPSWRIPRGSSSTCILWWTRVTRRCWESCSDRRQTGANWR
jgi:sigma-B regulation protein RsbU (phosphoserine phosphatase)